MTPARVFIGVLSFLTVAVTAKSNSTTTTNTTDTFDMPAGVSGGCQSFLDTLNADTSLSNCITSVLSATSAFNASNSSPTSSQVQAAISQLCSADSSCDVGDIGVQLTGFAQNCANELDNIPEILTLYDVLYAIKPLSDAICTKDPNTGQLCITQAETVGNDTLDVSGDNSQQPLTADLNAFGAAYLPFLFVGPSSPSSVLCSPCTTAILTNYLSFETNVIYAVGLNGSPLFGNQATLWQAIQTTCNQSVANAVVANVESAQGQTTTSGAGAPSACLSGLVVAGVFGVVFALL